MPPHIGYMTPHEFKQNWHPNKPELTTVMAHKPGQVSFRQQKA